MALRTLAPEEQAHLDRLVARTRKSPRLTLNAWQHVWREAERAGLEKHLAKIVDADIAALRKGVTAARAAEPPFHRGQPVRNKRSGVISWVLVAGVETMLVSFSGRDGSTEVKTANYEDATDDAPYSMPQSTSYGSNTTGLD